MNAFTIFPWTALVMALGLAVPSAHGGVTFTALVPFGGTNGSQLTAGLVQAADGNFYGVTVQGGQNSTGTVFRVTAGGAFTSLLSFTGGPDGSNPQATLARGTDGQLYGTTSTGAANDRGTIFKITTSGALTTLFTFHNTNGAFAGGGLTQSADGDFYGAASILGPACCGTLFRMTPGGAFTTLVAFNGPNGSGPNCQLLPGPDGKFYGTAPRGAANDAGAIFELATNGAFTILASFNGTNGAWPRGTLARDANGNIYGVTQYGGPGYNGSPLSGNGTVFKFTPGAGLTSLHSFAGGTNGLGPAGGLTPGSDGNFYGTTTSAGSFGTGTIFSITPGGVLTTLYVLQTADGAAPVSPVLQGTDGNFYGTTQIGGPNGGGTVFRLSVPLAPEFQNVTQTGSSITFVWSTVAGLSYQLQYTTNLASANWTDLGSPITATNGAALGSDLIGSDLQRFYRAILLP